MKFSNTSLSILLVVSSVCFAAVIQGPTVYSLNATPTEMVMSDDGSTIAITYSSQKNVDVFLNNGSTFNLHQSIASTIGSVHAAISGLNSLYLSNGGIQKYQKDVNGNYQRSLQLTISKPIYDIDVCTGEENIGVGTDTGPYYYSGTTFVQRSISVDYTMYSVEQVQYSYDCSWVSLLLSDMTIRNLKNLPTFQQYQKFHHADPPTDVRISDSYILATFSSYVLLYTRSSRFSLSQNLTGEGFDAKKIAMTSDFSVFVSGRADNIFSLYTLSNGLYNVDFKHSIGAEIVDSALDENTTLFACISTDQKLYVFYKCPDFCSVCSFVNVCTVCQSGYYVQGGQCIAGVAPTPVNNETSTDKKNQTSANQTSSAVNMVPCTGGITIMDGICEQFCHDKCRSCTEVWTECVECADFYIKDDQGNCVIENGVLSAVTVARPILNLLKGKAFTNLFFAISDLRFYDYHNKDYNGLEKQVFMTIRFVEEKQWELIGMASTKDRVEGSIEFASQYYPESNPTYLVEERKGNLFIESTIDYFVFFLPFTLVTVILFNRLFYCLFNYQISKYLRVYSFWWVIPELLIQKNVELFTFLGFRNFAIMYQYDVPSKMILILNILVFFITFLTAFCSYLFYYGEYGRLAKYFLNNMFRFPSSYALMIIVYGIKPFLKGTIHALLYKQWTIQIWMLLGVELLIILTIFIMEFRNDNHRSKLVFMMDITYSFSFAIFDLLLLLKYEYLAKDEELVAVTEEVMATIIYFMVGMTLLKLVWELVPWDILKALILCEMPDEQEKEESEKQNEETKVEEGKEEQKKEEKPLKKNKKQKKKKKKSKDTEEENEKEEKKTKKTKKIQKDQKKEKKNSNKKNNTPRQAKDKEQQNRQKEEKSEKKKQKQHLVINEKEKKKEEIPTIRLNWKRRT